jgi:hypothetical protein
LALNNKDDLIGRVIRHGEHWIKVLREVEPKRKPNGTIKNRRCLCLCKCGNLFVTNRGSLINGDTKSCSCLRKKNVLNRRVDIEQLVGHKYGPVGKEIEILYEVETKILSDGTPRRMVRCRCHCGNEFDADFHNLKHGHITSCGCLHHKRDDSCFGNKYGDDISHVIPLRDAADQIINGIPKRMLLCKCSCGKEFITRKDMLLSGRTKSCGCRVGEPSLGELRLEELFCELGFDFKKQHSFDSCFNSDTNRKLKFDFYLQNHGILVEYDGDQHFRESRGFDKEPLVDRIARDKIKDDWCVENNIPLLRIPYTAYKHLDQEYVKGAIDLAIRNSENGNMLTFIHNELYNNRDTVNNFNVEVA